jgi:hypothetical protein
MTHSHSEVFPTLASYLAGLELSFNPETEYSNLRFAWCCSIAVVKCRDHNLSPLKQNHVLSIRFLSIIHNDAAIYYHSPRQWQKCALINGSLRDVNN